MPHATDPPLELDTGDTVGSDEAAESGDAAMHEKIALIHDAEAGLLAAMEVYRQAINSEPAFPSTPITYVPTKALFDNHRYDINELHARRYFGKDPVYAAAIEAEFPTLVSTMLAQSPDWEDRIRAATLHFAQHDAITLPDNFPCIYEPVTAPRQARNKFPRPMPWVVSPDEEMLRELLPLYQELWGAYEAQWPNSPKRSFEVGHLDGLSPNGVYRPGATPSQVIGNTMLTHTGMYATAPEHLRQMHPQYEQWTKKPATA